MNPKRGLCIIIFPKFSFFTAPRWDVCPSGGRLFMAAFKLFFERIAWQCVEAELVDGSKLFWEQIKGTIHDTSCRR